MGRGARSRSAAGSLVAAFVGLSCFGCNAGDRRELIRPRLVAEERTRTTLPFDMKRGAAYGLRIRCDAGPPLVEELDAHELDLGTVALEMRLNELGLAGARLEISPARLEKVAYRAWAAEDGDPAGLSELQVPRPYLHPEERAQLPLGALRDERRPGASGLAGGEDLRLVRRERYAWTFDLNLDLRFVDPVVIPMRAELEPDAPYPGHWVLLLQSHGGDGLRFDVLGPDCLELPRS